MNLNFRVDWGYQYSYSRRLYHPVYIWDGRLDCTNGKILNLYKLKYKNSFPVGWVGPALNPYKEKLEGNTWTSKTRRDLEGIKVEADVEANCEFKLTTQSGTFSFTSMDIIDKKRIEFSVGPKYLGCFVTVTLENYLWYRPEPKETETVFEGEQLNLPIHNWARMRLSWLKPGERVSWEYDVKKTNADYTETLFHIEAMIAPEYSEEESVISVDYIPMKLYCDGEPIISFKHRFRAHDQYQQILDDVWQRYPMKPGRHKFELENLNKEHCLAISRIILSQSERNHGQISVPEWGILNEKLIGKVFAVKDDILQVEVNNSLQMLECSFGWNEFEYSSESPGVIKIKTANDTAETLIYDCEDEKYPVKVGYDMTQIVHDDTGELDWLLDYTQRTRLGNYVLFRHFGAPIDESLIAKWAKFCKNHGLYISSSSFEYYKSLNDSGGEMVNECGRHELSGVLYAHNPKDDTYSISMKEASEKYIKFISGHIEENRKVANNIAFGDASGGIRYAFLAGADSVRAETMVPHTMTLLSQARPAAEALGKGRWGVHIAMQHAYHPYRSTHLGQYFLSLMQPWIMGAEMLYEEDSLFGMWSEERQTWGDFLVKGKRDMTRNFYKFAKTHPRKGESVRNIAFIEGRYAAPFNGFIAGGEQDPDYTVWGLYGNNAEEWGHRQPEKCRQLLDVLMPGASTHPLKQDFTKRRFYFSGTPFGDFDCVPIEADEQYFHQYKLMLNLGWNTFIEEDYNKLKKFVENGGVLLTGIPQFSEHIKRDFLKDMADLNLFNDGDFSEFCGMKVKDVGVEYCGKWNSSETGNMYIPQLSAIPSKSVMEDGKAFLADVEISSAEVIAWDSDTGKPMLVRNKYGSGYVYTFTLWAYPGHELFQEFTSSWIYKLCDDTLGEVYVQDESNEVFWSIRKNAESIIIYMLNTDWTKVGNEKNINLVVHNKKHQLSIKEGVLTEAIINTDDVTVNIYNL